MKSDAARQVVWERLPDVELSAEAQRFLGMRELLYTDSYVVEDGAPVESGNRNEDRAGSWILYTPTGHMMVHLMAREGRTPYAGDTPTPEESLAAYRTYGGYFGPFTVHEDADPPYVVHHQEGRTRPVSGGDGRRAALPARWRRPAPRRPAAHERGRRDRRRTPLLGAAPAPAGVA